MGFRSCARKDDAFTQRVRDTYGSNVVAAPRAGIDPVTTLAVRDRKVEPWGHLSHLVDGGPLTLPPVTSAAAVALAGVRSSSVDAAIGLDLSGKFLSALGLPVPGAELTSTIWKGAKEFSFEVRDVEEHQVDVGALGQAVKGATLTDSPATRIFVDDKSVRLLIITRTLTARSVAIQASGSGGQGIEVGVDAIADLVGQAQADVTWNAERTDKVVFTGPDPVTFGFAAVPCAIDADRRLVFGLNRSDLTLAPSVDPSEVRAGPVIDEAGLISFDVIAP